MSHIPTQAFALIGVFGLGMLVAIVLMLLAIRQAMRDARKPQGSRGGMAAIMGRWPGDETEEEIEQELERL